MNKRKLLNIGALAVLIVLVIVLDHTVNSYMRRILHLCAIYAILGLSMNLVNGFTGLFSLGQAGFMAVGAYVTAMFTLPLELRSMVYYLQPMHPAIAGILLPLPVTLLLGGLVAALFALLIGLPVLRLKGDYLAIATLGFSEIIRIVLTNLQSVTNGALGINKVPNIRSLWWTLGTAIVVMVLLTLLIRSTYGRAFKAIREDEVAAEAMGIYLFSHKMLSFAIGAFWAGVGGGLYAALLGTVDPKAFYFTLTYNFLLIIVLGGMGSLSGTVIAAFIVTGGLELLRRLDSPVSIGGFVIPLFRPGLRMVMFSVLLMLVVLFYSKGLMGTDELTWDYVAERARRVRKRFTRSGGGS